MTVSKQTSVPGPHDSVRAELDAIEDEYPGWWIFLSDNGDHMGTYYASTPATPHGDSGQTVHAPTPELIRWEIAKAEQEIARMRAVAA